jgi:hypothetical protein
VVQVTETQAHDHDEDLGLAQSARIRAMIAADIAALEPLLDDALAYVHSTGTVDTKQSFLQRIRDGDLKYHALDRADPNLQVDGGLAIEHGHIRIDVDVSGGHRIVETRYLEAWVKRAGEWRLAVYVSLGLP